MAVTIRRVLESEGLKRKVPFTVEPYHFSEITEEKSFSVSMHPFRHTHSRGRYLGEYVGGVSESDLFGTGLTIDLNGDGDARDELPIRCLDGGDLRVGEDFVRRLGVVDHSGDILGVHVVYPASSIELSSDSGTRILRPLGARGATLHFRWPCDLAGPALREVGLAPAGTTVPVLQVPGPVLRVQVFEEQEGPSGEPDFTIEAITLDGRLVDVPIYQRWSYDARFDEPSHDGRFEGLGYGWSRSRWAMVSLSSEEEKAVVQFEVIDTSSAGAAPRRIKVTAEVFVGGARDERWAGSPPASRELER